MVQAQIPAGWRELVDRVIVRYREALGNDLLAVACFGSVARGEATPESDLDLYIVTREEIASLIDPRLKDFAPLYEYCIERSLPVQIHVGADRGTEASARPMALGVLARTYPRLKLVALCLNRWPNEMPGLLRRFPNLFLAVNPLPPTADTGPVAFGSLRALLRAAGGHRLMFASGWRGMDPDYPLRLETIRQLPWWRRRDVCWRTAARVYGPRIVGTPFQSQRPSR